MTRDICHYLFCLPLLPNCKRPEGREDNSLVHIFVTRDHTSSGTRQQPHKSINHEGKPRTNKLRKIYHLTAWQNMVDYFKPPYTWGSTPKSILCFTCQMSEIDCSRESLYNLWCESSENQSEFRHSSAYVCPSALSLHKCLLNVCSVTGNFLSWEQRW